MRLVASQAAERLRRFVRALKKRDELAAFFSVLNYSGEAFLFGGAPRDVAFGASGAVHDLDIFVSGPIDFDEVCRFANFVRRTKFGGFRLFVGSFEVDAWELNKSYAFRSKDASFISIKNLLRSVCFSTDGIAISLKSGRLSYTSEFQQSLESHCLSFVVPPVSLEPIVATRIARLALKLDLELAAPVASYLQGCLDLFGEDQLVRAELRWGNHGMLNSLTIAQLGAHIKDNSSPIRSEFEYAWSKVRSNLLSPTYTNKG